MSVLLESLLQTVTVPITGELSQYDLNFQISPIMLQGGYAGDGLLPITELTGGTPETVEQAFAFYLPMPGSTLISQTVAMYPFANQAIAANATIQQPLTLSMLMIAPVNQPGAYSAKQSIFSSIQTTLTNHNATGGMFVVNTPAFLYQNLLMTSMTDITGENYRQKQVQWQLDFIQPILTQQAAQNAQNALMQKISGGTRVPTTNGAISWSGQSLNTPANSPGVGASLAVAGNVSNITGIIG